MTLKIYLPSNIEKLISLVEQGCGNVLLRLSDKSLLNLKNDSQAAAFFETGGIQVSQCQVGSSHDIGHRP